MGKSIAVCLTAVISLILKYNCIVSKQIGPYNIRKLIQEGIILNFEICICSGAIISFLFAIKVAFFFIFRQVFSSSEKISMMTQYSFLVKMIVDKLVYTFQFWKPSECFFFRELKV